MKSQMAALLAAAALVGTLWRLPPPSEHEEGLRLAGDGRAILAAKCQRCHAIGTSGESPHAKAPPFRTLSAKYPVTHLAEAMAEGLSTGHPDMPEFIFSPDEIAAILAYLGTLGDHPRTKAQPPAAPAKDRR
jgi:mono/diheme cytochrome c family protein